MVLRAAAAGRPAAAGMMSRDQPWLAPRAPAISMGPLGNLDRLVCPRRAMLRFGCAVVAGRPQRQCAQGVQLARAFGDAAQNS